MSDPGIFLMRKTLPGGFLGQASSSVGKEGFLDEKAILKSGEDGSSYHLEGYVLTPSALKGKRKPRNRDA